MGVEGIAQGEINRGEIAQPTLGFEPTTFRSQAQHPNAKSHTLYPYMPFVSLESLDA